MRILVVGSGGREHALVHALAQGKDGEVWCAPGNAGIAQEAHCVPIGTTDLEGLVQWAREHQMDLTVVGPEAPLVAGLVDQFRAAGLACFGPMAQAARIEGSKAFAKELMAREGIPTPSFEIFDNPAAARRHLEKMPAPVVVKADGLAAGKGVFVCRTREEALQAVDRLMEERIFGEAGRVVVIEECLEGEEASFMGITDGETVLPLPPSQDHKRLGEGDTGPNTGGMGAYSPAPVVTPEVAETILDQILRPAVAALARRGTPYQGVLYAGLMLTRKGPQVLEFNCRFGDPEAQVVLPGITGDWAEILQATLEGRLEAVTLQPRPEWNLCVVLAARGYPDSPEKGQPIFGLEEAAALEGITLYHAGTVRKDNQWITAGGRVLGVTATAPTFQEARRRAYAAVSRIHFDGMQYRRDIGARALSHFPQKGGS